METRLHKTLALRLLGVAALLSGVMGGVVYLQAMRETDRMVATLAETETSRVIGPIVDALRNPDPADRRILAEAGEQLLKSRFLAVELYGADRRKVVEIRREGSANLAERAESLRMRFPPAGQSSFQRFVIDGILYLEVMIPLKGTDNEISGYFEGVYAVDAPTLRRIMQGVGSSILFTILTVVATSGAVYPVVLRLNRRLVQRSRDLARSNRDLSEANAANQAKTEFLANMSHELRSPLNAILGFSEIMNRRMFGAIGNERYEGYVRDIHESGHHLLDLINDILDLSKVEAGKLELAEEEVEVAALAENCRRLVAERAGSLGVQIAVEVDFPPGKVRADARKLKQIMINLLTNAIKFTPPGGRITLSVARAGDGGAAFTVSDTGIGIAEADIPKVLQPFGQVADPLVRSQEGTGLGLPLSKRLAELHGGELSIRSRPGNGTTVTVQLPAERVVDASPADAMPSICPPPPES